ncbi:MBL fold metallo-hydrolase [Novipirellula artificiosorum]|uniref:Ribonuclease Z n=1 Tax=Novipirellula artificiosorum TaxID=2528016 RepID=A0A5C6E2Z7_9BACT|nr:MBL fold metallo-hydrolase [Novipirellula artificiosorum]TWU42337.1 ribonuclease Z [Novipirellula artificiosorum]
MRLHCLGTVGYHPNARRHTSCYFLPESGILLDAGSGVFRLPGLIETDSIDILLSHAHLDHIVGLTFLLDVFHQRPVKRCRIWGEQKKIDAVRKHLFSELIFPAQIDAEWVAIDDQVEFSIGDARVSWRPQTHPGGSVAYAVQWSQPAKKLIYVSDTTGDRTQEAIEWSKHCDLLMHECYFRDAHAEWAKKTGHSWTSRVAEIAKQVLPKKLLLTHINPMETSEDPIGIDGVRRECAAEVILAEDEMVLDF